MTASAAPHRHTSRHAVHVNFTWSSFDEVTYERMPPAPPNEAPTVLLVVEAAGAATGGGTNPTPPTVSAPVAVRWECILKTQAFQHPKETYARCYHYDLKGCCQRGARCAFVHVVTIGECEGTIRRRHRRRPHHGGAAARSPRDSRTPTTDDLSALVAGDGVATAAPPAPSQQQRQGIVRTSDGGWFRDPYQLSNAVRISIADDDNGTEPQAPFRRSPSDGDFFP